MQDYIFPILNLGSIVDTLSRVIEENCVITQTLLCSINHCITHNSDDTKFKLIKKNQIHAQQLKIHAHNSEWNCRKNVTFPALQHAGSDDAHFCNNRHDVIITMK